MDVAAALICAEVVLDQIMDTSSSSDEEDILNIFERHPLPRVEGFVENVVHAYTEVNFKKNFRLSRESASHITERFSQSYSRRIYKGGKIQTSVETQVLCFLWFSGNKTTFREVANIFGMSLSTVHACFNNVLKFLTDDMAPEIIQFPRTGEEKERVAYDFKKVSGIPNVLGCIDGTYLNIRTPLNKIRSTYANRHDGVSITLQGICDSNLKFLDVFTGVPSKIDDSRVLKLSSIGKELSSLCSPKYFLLGDAAYPLRNYLLTPYRDYGNLSEAEKNFNNHFCRTRVKIENAFGVLKCRFQQLMRMNFHNVETMAKFVIACCVLHNICIERNESLPEEVLNTELSNNSEHFVESDRREIDEMGQLRRDEVKNILFNS